MTDKLEKKLLSAFWGIKESKQWNNEAKLINYVFKCNKPPPLLVKIALTHLTKKIPRHGGDKSAWEVCLEYKGKIWLIQDWRRISWNLYGSINSTSEADELIKKIKAACSLINNELKTEGKNALNNNQFSIQNQHGKTKALYEFFRNLTEDVLSGNLIYPGDRLSTLNEDLKINNLDEFLKNLNKNLKSTFSLRALTIATVIFFFAHYETIMDSCFAIGNRKGITFIKWRSFDWSERFKYLFPMNERITQEIYEQIDFIRKNYRNVFSHSTPVFFMQINGLGLIPFNFDFLFEPRWQDYYEFEESEAENIFSIIDKALGLVKNHENTKFGYIYSESDLPIHIHSEATEKLKQYMTSVDSFQNELMKRCEIQDKIINMEL